MKALQLSCTHLCRIGTRRQPGKIEGTVIFRDRLTRRRPVTAIKTDDDAAQGFPGTICLFVDHPRHFTEDVDGDLQYFELVGVDDDPDRLVADVPGYALKR